VLAQAKKYSQQTLNVSAACGTFQQTVQQRAVDFGGSRAMVAVQFACMQLGKPYVWGGNGPELTELPNGKHKVTGGSTAQG
jgi:cell wall-associated NlpC family hydrolase